MAGEDQKPGETASGNLEGGLQTNMTIMQAKELLLHEALLGCMQNGLLLLLQMAVKGKRCLEAC